MANALNQVPVIIDTDMASGWRALQTLNVGNLQPTIQNPGPITRQWGVRVFKVTLETNGTTVAGTVTITRPGDNLVLWSYPVPAGATAGIIKSEDFAGSFPAWRDFQVQGVTATVTKVKIWYRA